MDDQTKDMLKEAYQYGYAHGIEDIRDHLKNILGTYVLNNPDIEDVYKKVFGGLMEVLTESAQATKAKDLTDY